MGQECYGGEMIPRIQEIKLQNVKGVIGKILTVRFTDGTAATLQVEDGQAYTSQAVIHVINEKLSQVEKLLSQQAR